MSTPEIAAGKEDASRLIRYAFAALPDKKVGFRDYRGASTTVILSEGEPKERALAARGPEPQSKDLLVIID